MSTALCMIALNAEKTIGRAIGSVIDGLVEAAYVNVDSRTTDATWDVAQEYGANLAQYDWTNDFAAARNAVIERAAKAKHDMVMILDTDEELTSFVDLGRLLDNIEDAPKPSNPVVYNFRVWDNFGNYLCSSPRLFSSSLRYSGRIHELPAFDSRASVTQTDIRIVHHTDPEQRVAKAQRNISMLTRELTLKPLDPYLWWYLAYEYMAVKDYDRARDIVGRLLMLGSFERLGDNVFAAKTRALMESIAQADP